MIVKSNFLSGLPIMKKTILALLAAVWILPQAANLALIADLDVLQYAFTRLTTPSPGSTVTYTFFGQLVYFL